MSQLLLLSLPLVMTLLCDVLASLLLGLRGSGVQKKSRLLSLPAGRFQGFGTPIHEYSHNTKKEGEEDDYLHYVYPQESCQPYVQMTNSSGSFSGVTVGTHKKRKPARLAHRRAAWRMGSSVASIKPQHLKEGEEDVCPSGRITCKNRANLSSCAPNSTQSCSDTSAPVLWGLCTPLALSSPECFRGVSNYDVDSRRRASDGSCCESGSWRYQPLCTLWSIGVLLRSFPDCVSEFREDLLWQAQQGLQQVSEVCAGPAMSRSKKENPMRQTYWRVVLKGKNHAKIAVARQLVRVIWRMLKDKQFWDASKIDERRCRSKAA